MTAIEKKFEFLKEDYDIDETCNIVINESERQVIYDIMDQEGNQLFIEFYPQLNEYVAAFNGEFIGEGTIE